MLKHFVNFVRFLAASLGKISPPAASAADERSKRLYQQSRIDAVRKIRSHSNDYLRPVAEI